MPAELAGIATTRSNAVMRRNLIALFAMDAVGVKVVFQPFQTGVIGRKLFAKIFDRVFRQLRFNCLRHMRLPHPAYDYDRKVTYRQGISSSANNVLRSAHRFIYATSGG